MRKHYYNVYESTSKRSRKKTRKNENSKQKKAVVYARVDNPDDRYSLNFQIFLCEEEIRKDNAETVHPPISDIATDNEIFRNGLSEILLLAEKRSINSVYMTRTDRLYQNTANREKLLQKLKSHGVKVKVVKGISPAALALL